jgi:hypothetical protein
MDVTRNELIIIILLIILVCIYTKYSTDYALKAIPALLIIYGILYLCNLTGLEEHFQLLDNNVQYNEKGEIVNKKGEIRSGAHDANGEPICYSLESLYEYLEKLKNGI